jgi:hypothetical protein
MDAMSRCEPAGPHEDHRKTMRVITDPSVSLEADHLHQISVEVAPLGLPSQGQMSEDLATEAFRRPETRREMATSLTSSATDQDLTCHAMQLALVATQLRRAWHAGVLDAETAMQSLDVAVREVCYLRAMERSGDGVQTAATE